jgi:hypothetical protein
VSRLASIHKIHLPRGEARTRDQNDLPGIVQQLFGHDILSLVCLIDQPAITVPSTRVLFYPRDILVHPVLQKLLAACTDVAVLVKQTIL